LSTDEGSETSQDSEVTSDDDSTDQDNGVDGEEGCDRSASTVDDEVRSLIGFNIFCN
jgi:hypothetical protein